MNEIPLHSYKSLIVWQKAVDLVVLIYELIELFPKTERYGLSSQMTRAAVSIPSNIAEGRRRGTKKDFKHFLQIAFASGAELETQIEICKRLPWGKGISFDVAEQILLEVMKMLNRMIINFVIEETGS
jgi:four helix bundle protein